MSELLEILGITKQSLSRVLGQLVRQGFVVQRADRRDRRRRLLELTDRGRELERQLSENQRRRMARAYRNAGAESVEGFRTVLRNLMDERDRTRLDPGASSPKLAARR